MADMVTRWFKGYRGNRSVVVKYIREILGEHDLMGSPSDMTFEWPELHMIKFSQVKYSRMKPSAAFTEDGMIKVGGNIWILQKNLGLQFDILISAH